MARPRTSRGRRVVPRGSLRRYDAFVRSIADQLVARIDAIERIHVLTFQAVRSPAWEFTAWHKHSAIAEELGRWPLGSWFDALGSHSHCFDLIAAPLRAQVLKRIALQDLSGFFCIQVTDQHGRPIGDLA